MALIRGLSAGMLAALSGDVFHPVALVELDWPGGVIFAHTNAGTISWDGDDYLGVGKYGAITIPAEVIDIVPAEAVLVIAGTTAALIGQTGVDIRGRRCRIWFGCVTVAGGTVLVDDPALYFSGKVDGRDFSYERDDGTVIEALALTILSGVSARAGASITHTEADQAAKFPGDTAGRHNIYATANRINPPKW